MTELDDLVSRRLELRTEEAELTAQIKDFRAKDAEKRRMGRESKYTVSSKAYKNLQRENFRLRGLFALLAKVEDRTYSQVAELLDLSVLRSRSIVQREIRYMQGLIWREEREHARGAQIGGVA